MTRKTSAICYIIAGVCFAISGAAGFVAGRTGYAVIRIILGGILIFLAYQNMKFYKQEVADQALKDAGIDPQEYAAQTAEAEMQTPETSSENKADSEE